MVEQNFVQQKWDNEYSGNIKSMEKFMSCKNTIFCFSKKSYFFHKEFFGILMRLVLQGK